MGLRAGPAACVFGIVCGPAVAILGGGTLEAGLWPESASGYRLMDSAFLAGGFGGSLHESDMGLAESGGRGSRRRACLRASALLD